MNSISLQHGRVNQKLKTRTRILHAAKQLMAKNQKITLEDVAAEAKVSRATIYRYFSNFDLLCAETSLDIHHIAPTELLEEVKALTFEQRILYVQNYYNQLAQDHELVFRRYLSSVLSASVDSKQKLRGARRAETMDLIMSSINTGLSNKDLKHLKNIATVLMGIDAVIVAKDVCGLSNQQTSESLEWGIRMILKGLESAP
jgi:AcrR family transcriptional regulator